MDVDGADLDEARGTQGTASALKGLGDVSDTATETQVTPGGPCASVARCKAIMKVRILIPGRKVDDVAYRCEKCGSEVLRSVPRAW